MDSSSASSSPSSSASSSPSHSREEKIQAIVDTFGAKGKRILASYHDALSNKDHQDITHPSGDYGKVLLSMKESYEGPHFTNLNEHLELLGFPTKDYVFMGSEDNESIDYPYKNIAHTESSIIICISNMADLDSVQPRMRLSDLLFKLWKRACFRNEDSPHGLRMIVQEDIINDATTLLMEKWYDHWGIPHEKSHLWSYDATKPEDAEQNRAYMELVATDNVKSIFFMLTDHRNGLSNDEGIHLEVQGIVTNLHPDDGSHIRSYIMIQIGEPKES